MSDELRFKITEIQNQFLDDYERLREDVKFALIELKKMKKEQDEENNTFNLRITNIYNELRKRFL